MKIKKLASVWKRVCATILDYLLFYAIVYAYIVLFGKEIDGGQEVSGIMTLPILIGWLFYFVVAESIWQGTLGHLLFKIIVRQESGDTIDIGHSFKRRICDIPDFILFGLPAFILINNNDKRQRIGDMYAKTIVVDEVP